MRRLDKLIIDFKRGNSDAFDEIYELTKTTVYLSIYAIIKNRVIIDDLMQDTYMKALEKIELYKTGTNFKAWISRIARNITINFYNRDKKETLYDPLENIEMFDAPVEVSNIDAATSALDGIEREVFIYRVVLGFGFGDIDKALELKPRQSQYIFKKALDKVKEKV